MASLFQAMLDFYARFSDLESFLVCHRASNLGHKRKESRRFSRTLYLALPCEIPAMHCVSVSKASEVRIM